MILDSLILMIFSNSLVCNISLSCSLDIELKLSIFGTRCLVFYIVSYMFQQCNLPQQTLQRQFKRFMRMSGAPGIKLLLYLKWVNHKECMLLWEKVSDTNLFCCKPRPSSFIQSVFGSIWNLIYIYLWHFFHLAQHISYRLSW